MSGRLRVAIDATAVPGDRGGVGRYVDALLPSLARAEVDLAVICQRRDAALLADLAPGAQVVVGSGALVRRPVRLAWEQVELPRIVRRLAADVLHSPHYTAPLVGRFGRVVTLHDATFFSHPQLHSRSKVLLFRAATRRAVASGATLVVPSRATATEIARFTGASADRFVVAYHGVDPRVFHPAADRTAVRRAVGLRADETYVAFLGTLEPRKNLPALVRGWVEAVRDRSDPPALVLAGGPGWDPRLDSAIRAVPAGLRVIRTGYLPVEQLSGFLSGAIVVAYPSLGEGFGLPVLEAMACGAPVLTTNRLALPEVGGDAVAYTGTTSEQIAEQLSALIDDEARRTTFGAAGLARSAQFTWDAAAAVHLEAYRRAADPIRN